MTISVIMPAYNTEKYICEAIRSVINQTFKDWELIVVDDCSTDRTVEIVNSFTDPRIRLIRQQQNSGPSAARLAGTLAASYDYIYYFDSDDILCPRILEVLSKVMDNNPKAVLVYANYTRIDSKGKKLGVRSLFSFFARPSGNVLEAFLKGSTLQIGSALIRRHPILFTHCWERNLRCGEDWVSWTMLATVGQFVYVPGFIAFQCRELPSGISRTVSTEYNNMLPALDAVFNSPRLIQRFSPEKLRALRNIREAHIWVYIAMLSARKREWKKAFSCFLNAVKKSPRRSPVNLVKFTLAIADALV